MKNADDRTLALTDIRPLIHEIRGVQVMLDRDLAVLYGVETGALNRAVKRNAERFPEDFIFQLTDDEILKCQNGISKSKGRGGIRYRPFAFTEHGISMLSGVLHSATAVRVNIAIVRAFILQRRMLSNVVPALTSITARVEVNERRQIVDQARNEERFDLIFAKMGEGEVPPAQVFYQGKFWDAKSLLIKLIRRAKKELIVIDAYVGTATLDMLAKRGRGVKIELVTHANGELAESDFEAFNRQYGRFTKTLCGVCHDRFIIADQKEIFWSGASLKDAGRLTFAVAQLGAEIIPGLLASIRAAAR